MKKLILMLTLSIILTSTAFGRSKHIEYVDFTISVEMINFMEWVLTTDQIKIDGEPTKEQINTYKESIGMDNNWPKEFFLTADATALECQTARWPKSCKLVTRVESKKIKGVRDEIELFAERSFTLEELAAFKRAVAGPLISYYQGKESPPLKSSYKSTFDNRVYSCVYPHNSRDLPSTVNCSMTERISKITIDRELYNAKMGHLFENGKDAGYSMVSNVRLEAKTNPRGSFQEKNKQFLKQVGAVR